MNPLKNTTLATLKEYGLHNPVIVKSVDFDGKIFLENLISTNNKDAQNFITNNNDLTAEDIKEINLDIKEETAHYESILNSSSLKSSKELIKFSNNMEVKAIFVESDDKINSFFKTPMPVVNSYGDTVELIEVSGEQYDNTSILEVLLFDDSYPILVDFIESNFDA